MMKEHDFWNKLRILVTNKCNYRCPFCHNEGQDKDNSADVMKLTDFISFVDFMKDQPISELHFSGGEPFLNHEIVDMIEYADKNTTWGIGCATNLSRLTDEQIHRLANTRVKFNIQFPYADKDDFHKSTGTGSYSHIIEQITKVKKAGIRISLNSVVQSDDMKHIQNLINFAIKYQLPLKLLPQIGLDGSDKFKELIYPLLKETSIEVKDKGTGALRWIIEKEDKQTVVLYIDSPCFDKDITECREFGELRVHPDFTLQPCILRSSNVRLNLQEGKEKAIEQMTCLWNDFKHC